MNECAELAILAHALGWHGEGRKTTRRHYVTGEWSEDYRVCEALEAKGRLVRRRMHPELTGGDTCFVVTAEGESWCRAHLPPPPRLTRSQQRYRKYLAISDGTELSFGEYLRSKLCRSENS